MESISTEDKTANRFPLAIVGGVAAGAGGYFIFGWLARQGFYAVALPGALLGAGWGLLARRRSLPVSTVCSLAALGLGIFAEWDHFPFIADSSFGYFLAHLHLLPPVKILMIVLGGVFG